MIATGKLIAAMVLLTLPMYGALGHRSGNFRSSTFWMAFPLTTAAMLLAGSLLAYAGILWAFFPLWGVSALGVLWMCRKDWKPDSLRSMPSWKIILPGAAVFLLQAMPVAMQDFPAGWDPACHALIAEKIRQSGTLCADWRPFEDLPMLYPQGFHTLAALLSMLTGCAIHTVLQNLHLLLTFPATMLIWHIAGKTLGERAGLFALAAYAFLTDTGNYLYFYRMGMLPTECANGIFLGFLLLWLQREWDLRLKLAAALLCGAGIVLAHPLSGMIVLCVCGTAAVFCKDFRKLPAAAGTGAAIALILYFLSVSGRASAGNTESIKFAEEPAMPVFHVLEEIGWSVLPLAICGIFCAWKRRKEPEIRLLLIWPGVLTGIFAVMEYFFRFCIAEPFFGENFTIGIPSRFIAVSGTIFSIWAGYGMAQLSRIRRGWILTGIFVIFCGSGIWRYFQLAQTESVPEELQKLSAAVQRETPDEAYVLLPGGTEAYQWFSYLAWRASLGVPIPSSENRAMLTEKWLLFGNLDGNQEKIGAYLREHRMICMLLIPAAPGHWQMAMGMPDGRFRLLRQELHFVTKQQLHSKGEN